MERSRSISQWELGSFIVSIVKSENRPRLETDSSASFPRRPPDNPILHNSTTILLQPPFSASMCSVSRLFTTPLLLCSFISLSLFSSASLIDSAAGSRRLLRAITTGGDQPDFAVDLNVTNFDEVLRDTPAPFAIVEFFAHWCPACRNYKPQYEKVARLFNGANAIHPGIVLMTRVDCGIKVNTNLCDKFSISHYPSLFWGPTSKFVGGSWDGKNEKGEIRYIEDGRTSDRLLKWINTQTESSYNLEDEKYENAELLQSNSSSHGQIPRAISDVEEATSLAF